MTGNPLPDKSLVIEAWTADHPGWRSLQCLTARMDQEEWCAFTAEWHLSSHFLVAHRQWVPLGCLRYVIQYIGADADWSPIQLQGESLTEAKIIAFGVDVDHRRQGIGRRLQQTLIAQAKAAGCFQIRSRSDTLNTANYQLKLSLGFAIHPLEKTGERDGAYFLLPLRTPSGG